MKILGNTNDYYDCIQAYGMDQNCVYMRVREDIEFEKIRRGVGMGEADYSEPVNEMLAKFRRKSGRRWYQPYHKRLSEYDVGKIRFKEMLVGFCGKLYPCIEARYQKEGDWKTTTVYLYDYKTLRCWLSSHYDFEKAEKKDDRLWYEINYCLAAAEKLFEIGPVAWSEPFFQYKVPVFTLTFDHQWSEQKYTLTLNAVLQDIGFYKVFDPYAAYQEISMYLFGVLGVNEPDTVEISDEDMQQAKGFTDKHSFKTRPGTKKKRKVK